MKYAEPIAADSKFTIVDAEMMGLKGYGGLYILTTPKPALIETGFSHTVEKTLAALDELGVRPEEIAYIAATHVHMDHAGGTGYLAEACPNAKIICHHVGAPHLIDPTKLVASVQRAVGPLFEYYGSMKPVPAERLIAVKGSERFELGDGYALEILNTPGHAPHHASFYEPKTKGLFTGDAVGIYREGLGFTMTTPPPSLHYEDWQRTLTELRELDLECLYFTHYGAHGRPYELLDEFARRLRDWFEEVEAKWRELGDERAVKEYFVEKETDALASYYEPWMIRGEVEMNVTGVLLYLKKHRPSA
jgi:glyoxylase-like metal-dependent hydrolase (beta-lactamase superfamily II)